MEYPFKLKVFSPAFLEDAGARLEAGNKIIVHANMLKTFGHLLAGGAPLMFKLQNVGMTKYTHCGVLEFTCPNPKHVYVPRWIMDHLGVADCATILAQIAKNVPRAKFVRFRPVDAAFGDAVLDVKAQLEFSLRAFTVLTVGDVIPLSVRGRHARVEVIDVRPVSKAMAVCVIDTDCEVDVEVPASANNAPLPLLMGVPTPASISHGQELRFDALLPSCDFDVVVELNAAQVAGGESSADLDVYASTTQQRPSRFAYDWRNVDVGCKKTLVIPAAALGHREGAILHVAAIPYNLPIDETLSFEICVRAVSAAIATSSALSDTEAPPSAPGGVPCPNCAAEVAPASLDRHVAFCARNNTRCRVCNKVIRNTDMPSHAHCPRCGIVLRPEALSKHIELDHTPVTCDCGCTVDPTMMSTHASFECDLRTVACPYCDAHFIERRLREHKALCGSRRVSCTACGKPVLSADLAAHMERGCNDSAAAAFGDPRTLPAAAEGHLSWLRAIQDHLCSAEPPARVPSPGPGHPSTLEAASQGSGSMRCDSPADEEYHYSDDDDSAYTFVEPATAAPRLHVPDSLQCTPHQLPSYIAPGNGVAIIHDAADTVRLVAGVNRLDLDCDDGRNRCASCGDTFASEPLLQVHAASLCPKRGTA